MKSRGETADFGPWSGQRRLDEPFPATIVIVGCSSHVRLWGLTPAERVRRMAAFRGLELSEAVPDTGEMILVNGQYAFDPVLLDWVLAEPKRAVDENGIPVLVHTDAKSAPTIIGMITGGAASSPDWTGYERRVAGAALHFKELFKVEQPFVTRLGASNAWKAERLSYNAAYRGVTDLLTKYAWKGLAFHLVRFCARLGLPPNAVTLLGLIFCLSAAILFYHGAFRAGLGCALAFMILDTVDGKLARCTIQSSRFGDLLDHVTDVLHPPLWWWAWWQGTLGQTEETLGDELTGVAVSIAIGGYVAQRLLEAAFVLKFKMQIHLWREFDSRFKLITAQRNVHVLILGLCLALTGSKQGLVAIAVWTLFSLVVHAVRFAQAIRLQREGVPIASWLA